jgi:hypothetical protein
MAPQSSDTGSPASSKTRPSDPVILVKGGKDSPPFASRRIKGTVGPRRVRGMDACPVCWEPAVIMDWQPRADWLTVEDCLCTGFFVWTRLLDTRLPSLSPEDREILSLRLRGLRFMDREAWLTTHDGTLTGVIVLCDELPDWQSVGPDAAFKGLGPVPSPRRYRMGYWWQASLEALRTSLRPPPGGGSP